MSRRNPAAIPDRIILERIHFESVFSPMPDSLSRPATLVLAAILATSVSGAEKNSENRLADAQATELKELDQIYRPCLDILRGTVLRPGRCLIWRWRIIIGNKVCLPIGRTRPNSNWKRRRCFKNRVSSIPLP